MTYEEFLERIHVVSQYILPQHFLSRLTGWLSECRIPGVKNWCIRTFLNKYPVNMQEAVEQDAFAYLNFNQFFTRHLRDGMRPINTTPNIIVSPVDGSLSQFGAIQEGRIIQAKNHDYSVHELLGGDSQVTKAFTQGRFATTYLAPADYHRVHMPFAGQLLHMVHVPGHLFSVNPNTVSSVPNLFARNERVVCIFSTEVGLMAVVLVGAFLVASIQTVWSGVITPLSRQAVRRWDYTQQEQAPIVFAKGDEIGHFLLGSTVILAFANEAVQWAEHLQLDLPVKMGGVIAAF